jgi:hypothetical protein
LETALVKSRIQGAWPDDTLHVPRRTLHVPRRTWYHSLSTGCDAALVSLPLDWTEAGVSAFAVVTGATGAKGVPNASG